MITWNTPKKLEKPCTKALATCQSLVGLIFLFNKVLSWWTPTSSPLQKKGVWGPWTWRNPSETLNDSSDLIEKPSKVISA